MSEKEITKRKNIKWKYLLRQIFVSSLLWTIFFTYGLASGAVSVILPQIRKEANSTEIVSLELESWLSSAMGYASIPWMIIISYLAKKYGRRLPMLLVSVTSIGSFTFYYLATSPLQILLCEVMLGCLGGSTLTVALMITTECSTPEYRGIFLTIKSASLYWGIWISNILGTVFYYKIIPAFGILCSVYLLLVSFWCESPYWLFSKRRYDDGIKSHIWLKGRDSDANLELESIKTMSQRLNSGETENKINLKDIKSREFYMPCFLGISLMILYNFSGKMACSIYALQIFKKITHKESTAYTGMLTLDAFSVLCTYIGSILAKYLKRRTLLFYSSWTGITCLFLLSFYLFLVKLLIIAENSIATIGILAMFSISMSLGVAILSNSILAELMPLKYKSSTLCIAAIGTAIIYSTVLKLTPYLFISLDSYGAFLMFAITSCSITIVLQKYLPETKGKTLQEIEMIFKTKKTEDSVPLNKESI